MGLYDSFIIWRYCRYCDKVLPFPFQTKEIGQHMSKYGIGDKVYGVNGDRELRVIVTCIFCELRAGDEVKKLSELRDHPDYCRFIYGKAIIKNGIFKGVINIREYEDE